MVKGSARQQAAAAAKEEKKAAALADKASNSTSSSSSSSSQPDESSPKQSNLHSPPQLFETQAATNANNALAASLPPSLLQSAALALPPSSIMQQHVQAGVGGLPSSVSPPSGIARFATQPVIGGGAMVPPPSSFTRQLSRLPSTVPGAQTFQNNDWRTGVSVEERINIRRKLREAYFKHCPTYEQLLDTVTAVDEELLFSCSNNRIDYFKSSIDWDARIQLKRQQLRSTTSTAGAAPATSSSPTSNGKDKKRTGSEADLSSNTVSLLEVGINNSDLLPSSNGNTLEAPPSSLLAPASSTTIPRSPSKDTASSLVALGTGSNLPPTKKQRN